LEQVVVSGCPRAPAVIVDFFEECAMFSRIASRALEFLRNEDGPTAVEYAVMLALIIVVCITAITALGTNASNTFSYVATQVGATGS
jgi:pilus assembly protein Flp/PilA